MWVHHRACGNVLGARRHVRHTSSDMPVVELNRVREPVMPSVGELLVIGLLYGWHIL